MSVRRRYLGLALLLIIATGAVLAASAMVHADDKSHMEHAQHMHGSDAVAPTHPGQKAFGTIQEIVRILEADPVALHALQAKARRERPAEPALIAENLTLEQVARFELAGLEHPEFDIDVQHVRLYRHREQTAHVLGYLSEVGPQDIGASGGTYKRGDVMGRKGVERQYEPVLRGVDGEREA